MDFFEYNGAWEAKLPKVPKQSKLCGTIREFLREHPTDDPLSLPLRDSFLI